MIGLHTIVVDLAIGCASVNISKAIYHMIELINVLTERYEAKDYATDYSHGQPVPWIAFDDFLPADVLESVQQEIDKIPAHMWSNFTRNGSFMRECNNLKYSPAVRNLVMNLNSAEFLNWLEAMTGVKKLIPDPHLIGAGLMRCGRGHSLKLHTDFNWNEQLGLNRALSLILYVSREWKSNWNGSLEFWNFDRTKCLHTVEPKPNRLLIWNYHEQLWHGHPNPIKCPDGIMRDGLRLFYFTSNAVPSSPPHRSLYWFDEETKTPFDRKENR